MSDSDDDNDPPKRPRLKISLPRPALSRVMPVLFGLFAIGVTMMIFGSFTMLIGPDEFAVKQVFMGPGRGIQDGIIGPGLRLMIPGVETLHAFPRSMRLLEFNDDASASSMASVAPAIRIQTSEGYEVTVDVAIAYRIVDPYKVLTQVGPGKLYESSLMIPRSDKYLRQKLGELNAEEFYRHDLRRARAHEVRDLLQADVGAQGIEIWDVMVRHYVYDARYQGAIEQRKIQDQMVFKNRAEALAAAQEAEKNRVLAEGKASIEVERERGRGEVKKIAAEGELYYRQTVADGDLKVALAEAEGTRLENQALQTVGSQNMVGLKMADVLQGTQLIVIPTSGPGSENPLDLDGLIGGF